jgi:hypothetical protein
MSSLINDYRWVLKIISSCTNFEQVQTARNCVKQWHIKWGSMIDFNDEKVVSIYNKNTDILHKKLFKFEVRYEKEKSIL